MKKADLQYIKASLEYVLNDAEVKNNDHETHFNTFANAIALVDEELRLQETNPAMDKLNQLIEKYEIQKDFANELIGFDVALKLITKMLIDLKELKEQLKQNHGLSKNRVNN